MPFRPFPDWLLPYCRNSWATVSSDIFSSCLFDRAWSFVLIDFFFSAGRFFRSIMKSMTYSKLETHCAFPNWFFVSPFFAGFFFYADRFSARNARMLPSGVRSILGYCVLVYWELYLHMLYRNRSLGSENEISATKFCVVSCYAEYKRWKTHNRKMIIFESQKLVNLFP